MKARIVRAREVTGDDEVAWRALAGRAIEQNPLFEPECILPAARHQQHGGAIDVAFAEESGRYFACVPLMGVHRWRSFPYAFATTKVRRMSYCGTPLVDPERGGEAMAAIFTAMAQRRGVRHGRVLALDELADGGPVDRAVQEGARLARVALVRSQSWERPSLERRPEATYNSVHTKKDLSNMARLRRKLNASVGGEVGLVDRSADPTAVDQLIALEAAGYKAQTGVAMTTVAGEPEYFRAMCDRFRQEGRLHVYTLEGGGTVCAVVLLIGAADGLFMVKVGYDERFARSSPGLQLHLDLIQHFHDHLDANWIDVCTYEGNTTLLRMYPDRRPFASYFVPLGRHPADRLAISAFMAARPLHRRIVDAVRARRPAATEGNARTQSGSGTPEAGGGAGAPRPGASGAGGGPEASSGRRSDGRRSKRRPSDELASAGPSGA